MWYLLLSILSSGTLLLLFKLMDRNKVVLFPPIIINYLVATILGIWVSRASINESVAGSHAWFYISVIIGVLLIVNFFFVGHSTRFAGMAITTVAAKMSFIWPVIYSLSFDINDRFSFIKVIQIVMAVAAVLMAVYQKAGLSFKSSQVIYPLLLFLGLGIIDTLVKFSQYHFIKTQAASSAFSTCNFMVAGIAGLMIMPFKKQLIAEFMNIKVWMYGFVLGIVNFGSMYYLINALNSISANNSLVFGVNNIAIVALSVFIGTVFFKEALSKINWIGIFVSILVLIFMWKNF